MTREEIRTWVGEMTKGTTLLDDYYEAASECYAEYLVDRSLFNLGRSFDEKSTHYILGRDEVPSDKMEAIVNTISKDAEIQMDIKPGMSKEDGEKLINSLIWREHMGQSILSRQTVEYSVSAIFGKKFVGRKNHNRIVEEIEEIVRVHDPKIVRNVVMSLLTQHNDIFSAIYKDQNALKEYGSSLTLDSVMVANGLVLGALGIVQTVADRPIIGIPFSIMGLVLTVLNGSLVKRRVDKISEAKYDMNINVDALMTAIKDEIARLEAESER